MQAFADFSSKWSHEDYQPEPVALADLEEAEAQLGARLPQAYREAVLAVGLPSPTIALLHSVCEQEPDFADASDFFTPKEIVSSTQAWRAMGLREDHIAFADDCMGNLFAFADASQGPGSQVWFFDHDSGQTSLAASSFEVWVQQYLDLPRIEPDD